MIWKDSHDERIYDAMAQALDYLQSHQRMEDHDEWSRTCHDLYIAAASLKARIDYRADHRPKAVAP